MREIMGSDGVMGGKEMSWQDVTCSGKLFEDTPDDELKGYVSHPQPYS